jgi:hypothetical protein
MESWVQTTVGLAEEMSEKGTLILEAIPFPVSPEETVHTYSPAELVEDESCRLD